ncbi:MAG: ABC transporter substrate-binding protein, partial [Oligoflexales bacterium]|nr:ABC transporter substrate-binding protein [Oligoflexales bacterium]
MKLSLGSWFLISVLSAYLAGTVYARSLEEIKKTKELRICLVVYPGINYVEPKDCKEKCKYSGPAYDIANAFADHLKVKKTYKQITWDEQFYNDQGKTDREGEYTPEHVKTGNCDVYPNNVTKLPWREKKLAFAILFPSRMMVIINKKDKSTIKELKDLAGKSFVTQKDTSFHTWAVEQNK